MWLTQVMLSVAFPFGFMLCSVSALAAAYRPDRDSDVTQALNDVFWFIFAGLVGPLIFQVVILAFAVFIDKRERRASRAGSATSTSGTRSSGCRVVRSICSNLDRWREMGCSPCGYR
jgi:hypothetical protein